MQLSLMPSTKEITATRRNLHQNASMAIKDVYDAIVELVTNPDDRYQRLKDAGRLDGPGVIHIEVGRSRKGQSKIVVRDFADGMTANDMALKLSRVGERVSGLEGGHNVRGTNSRGAKDVASPRQGLLRVDREGRAVSSMCDHRTPQVHAAALRARNIECPQATRHSKRDRNGRDHRDRQEALCSAA